MFDILYEKVFLATMERKGYNPVSTGFFAISFVVLVYLYWLYAKKFDQKKFREAFIPWIILGGLLRFADGRLLSPTPLTITPGVFLVSLTAFTLFSLIDLELAKRVGVFLSFSLATLLLRFLNLKAIDYSLYAFLVTFGFYSILKKLPWMDDTLPWLSHLFEAWITSFGVKAGLIEEHVIANTLMQINPLLFGLVKTTLLLVIFYFLHDMKEEERLYVGTAILSIGLGPGIRDLLELLSI